MSSDRPEGRVSPSVLANVRWGRAIGLDTRGSRPGWRGASPARLVQIELLLLGALLAAARPVPCFADKVKQIVDTYAGSAVEDGLAVGVGVGVVAGNEPPRFFHYGYADCCKQPFTKDTIFEIGSVTKVFTTNLLGQSVNSGVLQLTDPLSSFSKQLGQLTPPTPEVTLQELGDFTGGFPDLPLCPVSNPPPGCLPLNPLPGCGPPDRPPVQCYGARDFLEFFQNTVPMNYNETPPQKVNPPPVPYFYSDFSTGLLGLLLGANGGQIDDHALDQWFTTLVNSLTGPLGMRSTYLTVPASAAPRIANGYDLAVATATVATQAPNTGRVTSIKVTNPGAHYSAPPQVQITGGAAPGQLPPRPSMPEGGLNPSL
jgi:CubicO group peptidase (beta-lactamase class C family)